MDSSLWSGRRGCLDLFALNVPTVFASKNFILLAKDLRTPLTGRSCLVRSRLTAIPHFASWTLSNRKTASASARSRNSLESKSHHCHQANKKHPSFDECSLLAGDEARLGFASRSESFAIEPSVQVCSISSLPEFRYAQYVRKSAELAKVSFSPVST